MSTIVKVDQGSPASHAHRAKYRNASETPVVLDEAKARLI